MVDVGEGEGGVDGGEGAVVWGYLPETGTNGCDGAVVALAYVDNEGGINDGGVRRT